MAKFNGTNSWIEKDATVAPTLQIELQEFTHNLWIKSSQVTGNYCIGWIRSGSTQFWECYFDASLIQFRVENEVLNVNLNSLNDGQLNLLSLVRDNDTGLSQGGFTGELRVYINGNIAGEQSVTRTKNLEDALANGTTEPITYGTRGTTHTLPYAGDMLFASVHVGTVIPVAKLLEEYNGRQPLCFDISPNKDTITEGWDLCDFAGSRGALIGYKGIQDLTVESNILYTGSAQIECEAYVPTITDFIAKYSYGNFVYGTGLQILTWEDDTGNYDLVQNTSGQQPTDNGADAVDMIATNNLSGLPVSLTTSTYHIELKQTNTSGYMRIFNKDGDNNFIRSVNNANDYSARGLTATPQSITLNNTGINKVVYNKLTFRFDGTNCDLFVNGILEDTQLFNESPDFTHLSRFSAESIIGSVKGFSIYNRALTDAEIALLN